MSVLSDKARWGPRPGDDGKVPTQQPSEQIRTFETGANRNAADHKHDYEGFLSPLALRRYGVYMHQHRHLADGTLRDSDNWQKGIPEDVYVKSLVRHVLDVWEIHRTGRGVVDFDGNMVTIEDALCGALFNAFGLLHTEVTREEPHGRSIMDGE